MSDPVKAWPAYSFKIKTPEGTIYVHIAEDENEKPVRVLINVGKAGSVLAAWGDSLAVLVTELILQHNGVYRAIELLAGMSHDRARLLGSEGIHCASGPDGVARALLAYREQKYKEHKPRGRSGGAQRE